MSTGYTKDEIRVGVLVLASIAILGLCLAAVFGLRPGRKSEYRLHFETVAGLETGSPVTYGGFQVGRVRHIRMSPEQDGRLEITIGVDREVRIPLDSVATIEAPIFGETTVEIQPGKPAAGYFAEGDLLPGQEPFNLNAALQRAETLIGTASDTVANLSGDIEEIAGRVETVLSSVQELVGSENREHIAGILEEADQLLAESRPQLKDSLARIETLTANLEETSRSARRAVGNIDQLLDENREEIDRLLVSAEGAASGLREALAQVDDLLTNQRGTLEETLTGMHETSQNLVEFTRLLKERPWSLVRKTKPREDVPAKTRDREAGVERAR